MLRSLGRRQRQGGGLKERIVIPYVPGRLFQETDDWGEANGAEFHDVGGDQEAYHRLLAALWSDGQAFVIVEQDIVPPPDALTGFVDCPEPFCCHGYPYNFGAWVYGHLGCSRFSDDLLRTYPGVVEESVREHNPVWIGSPNPRGWLMLSQRIKKALGRHGVTWHLHRPAAQHLSLAGLSRGELKGGVPQSLGL